MESRDGTDVDGGSTLSSSGARSEMGVAKRRTVVSSGPQRAEWVDVAKFIAILAVMTDHSNGVLYPTSGIVLASHFSVSLFIFLMGVTSFWSYRKHGVEGGMAKRCWTIFRPYLVATFVYCLFLHGRFDFTVYLGHLVRFDASGPLYYVLLYLQLLFVAPCLFATCRFGGKRAFLAEASTFLGVVALSVFTTNYTNILDVYGGGGKLFGGTYVILLYLGMLFGKYSPKLDAENRKTMRFALVAAGLTILWLFAVVPRRNLVDDLFPFGKGWNPPSIGLGVYALLIAATVFCAVKAIEKNRMEKLGRMLHGFAWLGKHTLYIFLYHRLFLDYLLANILPVPGGGFRFCWTTGVGFLIMIGGSIGLECLLKRLNRAFFRSPATA